MKTFISCFLFFFSINGVAQELTEGEVINFIKQVDSAFINKDAGALNKYLSDNAVLMGKSTVNGRTTPFETNKQKYVSAVSMGWKADKNYKYKKEKSQIKSINGNKAIVDEVVLEFVNYGGNSFKVRSHNQVYIKKSENGVIQTTKIIADSVLTKR